MIVLGVDPGLVRTGYGVIESKQNRLKLIEAGYVQTESLSPISERLSKIFQNLKAVFEERQPDVMVLEKIFTHAKHPATAILMSHARGVICLCAGVTNTPLVNIPSTRVKKAVVGYGHANKEQVAEAVYRALSIKPKKKNPADVTDALAVAIAYASINSREQIPI